MPVKCGLSLNLIVEKHELFCFFARFNESSSFDLKPTKFYGEKHLFRFRLCIFFLNEKGFSYFITYIDLRSLRPRKPLPSISLILFP